MKYYFAPMEGVTGAEFRRAHHQVFGGVDAYYMPFLSPTQDHVFTPRELRGILPETTLVFAPYPSCSPGMWKISSGPRESWRPWAMTR